MIKGIKKGDNHESQHRTRRGITVRYSYVEKVVLLGQLQHLPTRSNADNVRSFQHGFLNSRQGFFRVAGVRTRDKQRVWANELRDVVPFANADGDWNLSESERFDQICADATATHTGYQHVANVGALPDKIYCLTDAERLSQLLCKPLNQFFHQARLKTNIKGRP